MSAATHSSITITVDEDALREQVRLILKEEMRTIAQSLLYAAGAIEPSVIGDIAEYEREQGRLEGRLEAGIEQEGKQ